jgi:hypothetical protein
LIFHSKVGFLGYSQHCAAIRRALGLFTKYLLPLKSYKRLLRTSLLALHLRATGRLCNCLSLTHWPALTYTLPASCSPSDYHIRLSTLSTQHAQLSAPNSTHSTFQTLNSTMRSQLSIRDTISWATKSQRIPAPNAAKSPRKSPESALKATKPNRGARGYHKFNNGLLNVTRKGE